MLLHKQKSLYHLSDDEKSDLMDMILVAINEVTMIIGSRLLIQMKRNFLQCR